MAFVSELDNSDSDRSTSPEPEDPYYALSGPHVHNEMTLESKWPFSNVFGSSSWARTCPYLIETTSDRICFFIRGLPEPKGRFFSLGIDTRGHKHNHVLLFQFLLFSDWTRSRYKTKRFIAHFTLQDSFWLKKRFLRVEEVKHWFQIASKENVTFVMNFKYNIDHDFICHEPGHVKSWSCRLAKKRFKKCPPKRRITLNHILMPTVRENFGMFPGMQKVREERVQQGRALVKLPPFDTLLKKQNIGQLISNRMDWLMPVSSPVTLQESFSSCPTQMNWNDRDLLPIMSRLAHQINGGFRPQELTMNLEHAPNHELQQLPHHGLHSRQRGHRGAQAMKEPLPSCSYHRRVEDLSVRASTTSQLQAVPYVREELPAWRFAGRTSTSCWSQTATSSSERFCASRSTLPDIPEIPAETSENVDVLPPSPLQFSRTTRSPANRRRGRRRIIISCGGERFYINSKILEDASPVVKAFMKYWTPLPDPNGDIFLEIAGVTSIALENLLKYLTNDSFNHGVMRSSHMKELTRKLKIDLNHF